LHWLATGPTRPWQTTAPSTHTVMPGLHGGVARFAVGKLDSSCAVSPMHGGPPTTPTVGSARLLSVLPAQSSSSPLQSSGDGGVTCVQVSPPGPLGLLMTLPLRSFAQAYFATHCPSVLMALFDGSMQFASTPSTLSTELSQLLSTPSHT